MSSPSRPLVSALHFLPGSFHTVLLLSRLPRQAGPGLPLSRSVFSCFPPCRSDTLRPRGEITQVISPLRSQQFCASAQNCRLKNKPSGLFFNLPPLPAPESKFSIAQFHGGLHLSAVFPPHSDKKGRLTPPFTHVIPVPSSGSPGMDCPRPGCSAECPS